MTAPQQPGSVRWRWRRSQPRFGGASWTSWTGSSTATASAMPTPFRHRMNALGPQSHTDPVPEPLCREVGSRVLDQVAAPGHRSGWTARAWARLWADAPVRRGVDGRPEVLGGFWVG